MKVGDTVVLVGLVTTTYLNGKIAEIVEKDEEDRWLVNLTKDVVNMVIAEIAMSLSIILSLCDFGR